VEITGGDGGDSVFHLHRFNPLSTKRFRNPVEIGLFNPTALFPLCIKGLRATGGDAGDFFTLKGERWNTGY